MKSFQQFISESINIAGDFNGNLYMNSHQPETANESFLADVVWKGRLYRMEVEGKMMDKNQLTEQLQREYPGAIVHNVYPIAENSLTVKKAQRYRPERLSWSD
jgi:nuclear transport factor 2 (NTF2) superfamily protein